MRSLLVACVALAAGCTNFSPPCAKLSREVCSIKPETDACRFILDRDRKDEAAQAMCEELIPAAAAYAKDRTDTEARDAWMQARQRLATIGFAPDEKAHRIGEKLKAAGGGAGRMVEKVEGAYELEQQNFEKRFEELE